MTFKELMLFLITKRLGITGIIVLTLLTGGLGLLYVIWVLFTDRPPTDAPSLKVGDKCKISGYPYRTGEVEIIAVGWFYPGPGVRWEYKSRFIDGKPFGSDPSTKWEPDHHFSIDENEQFNNALKDLLRD